VQGESVEGQVPVLVVEDSVKANKGGAAPLVAPRELPILEVDFLQAAVIDRAPEPRHETKVKVLVVFVSCFVNQIEVSEYEPPRCVCRFQTSLVPEKGICWGVTRKIRMTTLTQERVLSTFKYKVRAQRDCDSLCK
jgi:hypothetical protein